MSNCGGPPHGPPHCSTVFSQQVIVVSEFCPLHPTLQLQLKLLSENAITMAHVMSIRMLMRKF